MQHFISLSCILFFKYYKTKKLLYDFKKKIEALKTKNLSKNFDIKLHLVIEKFKKKILGK